MAIMDGRGTDDSGMARRGVDRQERQGILGTIEDGHGVDRSGRSR